MTSDATARTRDPMIPGGMEGINPHREGIDLISGSGGSLVGSRLYAENGGDGGDGGDNCDPPRARAYSEGQGAETLLSCVGSDLSPPSPPYPPDLLQAVDLASLSFSEFCQSIPSHFQSIPSIPSQEKEGLQGIEGKGVATTTSSERAGGMTERKAWGFDHDINAGRARVAGEAKRVAKILDRATPPAAMQAAPIAPARGPQQLVPSFTVVGGGMRRVDGAHWRALSPLAAACAHAWQRHEVRNPDAHFVAPYSPAQIAVAEDYATLVELREAGGIRCSSLEAGRGGSGGGVFNDSYIQRGFWLAELQDRIGTGVAMDIRRHMDRGNHRSRITVRAAVDMLVLGAVPVKTILARFGWSPDMKAQKALRQAICGALDRMQGYRVGDPQDGA